MSDIRKKGNVVIRNVCENERGMRIEENTKPKTFLEQVYPSMISFEVGQSKCIDISWNKNLRAR